MSAIDREEFRNGMTEIAQRSITLVDPYDRVRCCQWILKLASIPEDTIQSAKLRNDYIQLLRIMVRSKFLHGMFLRLPPDGCLIPIAEALGNETARSFPHLPRAGPIAPIITHKSPDGQASISIKCIPGGGVFCYMSVSQED